MCLISENVPKWEHGSGEVLNGLQWVVRTGSPWRYMPHDLPPWAAVYQQTRRRLGRSRRPSTIWGGCSGCPPGGNPSREMP